VLYRVVFRQRVSAIVVSVVASIAAKQLAAVVQFSLDCSPGIQEGMFVGNPPDGFVL